MATTDNLPSYNCVKDNKAELRVPELSAQITTQTLWNNPWSWRKRNLNFNNKGRENNFTRQNVRESELKSTIQLHAIANCRRDVFQALGNNQDDEIVWFLRRKKNWVVAFVHNDQSKTIDQYSHYGSTVRCD